MPWKLKLHTSFSNYFWGNLLKLHNYIRDETLDIANQPSIKSQWNLQPLRGAYSNTVKVELRKLVN